MPRHRSDAVPEGNDPVPQQEEIGSNQPTLADVYRLTEELFDKSDRKMDELAEDMRVTDQRLASLEQDARQSRLAMKAEVQKDKETRERKEGAAKAVQEIHGHSCSANRVDTDPMFSTSFGDDSTGPPALPCSRDDGLVGNGVAAPQLCLSPLEALTNSRRWLTPRSLYNDEDHILSAASLVLLDRRDEFENFESIRLVLQQFYLRAAPSCWRIIENKSRQNRMFDPGDSKVPHRAWPVLGTWRALLCGEVMR